MPIIKWAELSDQQKVALVAEKVMGWKPFVEFDASWWKTLTSLMVYGWDCLHDWNHMQRVVEEMMRRGYALDCTIFPSGAAIAGFQHEDESDLQPMFRAESGLPEAVSLAALRACGVEVPDA